MSVVSKNVRRKVSRHVNRIKYKSINKQISTRYTKVIRKCLIKRKKRKKIVTDLVFRYYNHTPNRKNVTYFFFNGKIHITSVISFTKHASYHNWETLYSKIYGLHKNICVYLLSFLGHNINILYTNLDEFYFTFSKIFFKNYQLFLSLNWYLLHLKQRECLSIFERGKRFFRRFPCRGQRTRSNYKTCKKRFYNIKYNSYIKSLNSHYILQKYPNWKQINVFYFHRF